MFKRSQSSIHILLALLYSSFSFVQAAGLNPVSNQIDQREINREQQRQQQFQQQMQPDVDVRLPPTETPKATPLKALPADETPCFVINSIEVTGEAAARFQFARRQAIRQSGFKAGQCIGQQGLEYLTTLAQNALIQHGYTTSRILLGQQDLNSGRLILTVMPGHIRQVRYDDSDPNTHTGRIKHIPNKFPLHQGKILNLYDLEQGLENLRRLPTVEADMSIEPAQDAAGDGSQSDLAVKWRQRTIPVRMAVNLDDSGSHSTGRYQGGVTVALDNPLGLSDLFYANYNHDLGGKHSYTDSDGHKTGSGTNGYMLHYSVPVGYWLLAFNRSHYRYHQAVAGYAENYDYNGNSDTTDIGLSRIIQRNAKRKTTLGLKLWRRESHNFIEDAEIEVQQRHTAGWQANLSHREYLGKATLDFDLGYKRGTGAGHSQRAPEEAFNEGTSRMKIITADASVYWPFRLGQQTFSYDSSFHGQWNKTPLITQDQLSIGSRYTVRGFDGELSLMAPRGWYWQNNLNWAYQPQHQLYAGLDVGHIGTNSVNPQLGKTLAGAVIGTRGQFKAGGMLSYDLFAGKPIYKPQYFKTANTHVGFSLNYAF
ncbi:ShlB/FhaC/HecB family hemolysin secretion/activation protein [Neisseriaceae bacterium ESL0693]|nr:ShlB/FhaC/HecB family hemolysin secretion/activation protein [Neisseriaceae bacterium ESL0693]